MLEKGRPFAFLDATSYLQKRLGPSVGCSVRRPVRRSVRQSVNSVAFFNAVLEGEKAVIDDEVVTSYVTSRYFFFSSTLTVPLALPTKAAAI